MHPTVRAARIAGATYLLLCITGPIGLVYIPSRFFVDGNAAATAHNIATHEALFRFGIVSDLLTGVLGIFTAFALYRLLEVVNRGLAALMVMLGGPIVAAIYFFNALNSVGALLCARGGDLLSVFTKVQQDAMVMLFIRLHHHGVLVNEIFWGLWLVPFGLLVYRSGFLPRILGVWLLVNCAGYLALSLTGLLWPRYEELVANVTFPALFGEVAIVLWLLIRGANVQGAKHPRPAGGLAGAIW